MSNPFTNYQEEYTNFEILKLIYKNVPLIPSDAEGPELIRKHFNQAGELIFGLAKEKTIPEASNSEPVSASSASIHAEDLGSVQSP